MAAKKVTKNPQATSSMKRKRAPGNHNDNQVKISTPKKLKISQSNSEIVKKKEFQKPFKSSKPKRTVNSHNSNDDNAQKTKRESRIHSKELTEARKKKRKRHYNLEQELASLWEKMRRRNIAKGDRSKLVSEALQKMEGKIHEIAVSHVSSRVLQTCVKYCSQAERDAVFKELQPHLLTLACNTYAVHLVKKMLDNASKKQLEGVISSIHGHVASLLRHMVGSVVIEHVYELAKATQKQRMLMELYSTELQLFRDSVSTKESSVADLIPKLGLQKASVLRHMYSAIQPILEKGIIDHSIIHKALVEYFTIADKFTAIEIIQQLSSPLLVRMIHTRDGSKVGILCVKHGSAKERKKLIKGMKGHISKIAHDQCGSMVLVCILSIVDDTKLINKIIIRELQAALKELVFDKNGRRLILQLLHPNCPRYFNPDELASLDLYIPSVDLYIPPLCTKGESEVKSDLDNQTEFSKVGELGDEESKGDVEVTMAEATTSQDETPLPVGSGKKDPLLRRQELLISSGLAESLIDTCIENAGELLRSNFGKEVIFEVATGGAGDILRPTLDEKLDVLHGTIASLVAEPKSEGSEEEHILENFQSSRTIRKLILVCPAFACTLWKTALQGKSQLWAHGHSCKVVSAFMESTDAGVREVASEELQGLIDNGVLKHPEPKPKPLSLTRA